VELILGSQSPRRKEILNYFLLPFRQVSSSFDEEAIEFQGDPIAYAHLLSKGKGEILFYKFPQNLILTADTIVYREGKIYGKPKDEEEAFLNFKELGGNWHTVYTSLTLRYQETEKQAIEETRVLFNNLTDQQIKMYYKTLPYQDKAGGYTIQGAGSLIVNKIEGCYYNVMGLPLNSLRNLLLQFGIDLWNHLKS
jgi:septum formation protein